MLPANLEQPRGNEEGTTDDNQDSIQSQANNSNLHKDLIRKPGHAPKGGANGGGRARRGLSVSTEWAQERSWASIRSPDFGQSTAGEGLQEAFRVTQASGRIFLLSCHYLESSSNNCPRVGLLSCNTETAGTTTKGCRTDSDRKLSLPSLLE